MAEWYTSKLGSRIHEDPDCDFLNDPILATEREIDTQPKCCECSRGFRPYELRTMEIGEANP